MALRRNNTITWTLTRGECVKRENVIFYLLPGINQPFVERRSSLFYFNFPQPVVQFPDPSIRAPRWTWAALRTNDILIPRRFSAFFHSLRIPLFTQRSTAITPVSTTPPAALQRSSTLHNRRPLQRSSAGSIFTYIFVHRT